MTARQAGAGAEPRARRGACGTWARAGWQLAGVAAAGRRVRAPRTARPYAPRHVIQLRKMCCLAVFDAACMCCDVHFASTFDMAPAAPATRKPNYFELFIDTCVDAVNYNQPRLPCRSTRSPSCLASIADQINQIKSNQKLNCGQICRLCGDRRPAGVGPPRPIRSQPGAPAAQVPLGRLPEPRCRTITNHILAAVPRIIAVGDVHGDYDKTCALLRQARSRGHSESD